MKIVIATAVYYPQINGVAVFSHNLAVGLARRGHEVMVICPSQTGKNYTRMIDGVKTVYLRSVDVKVYPDQIHKIPEKKKVAGVRLPRLFYRKGFRVSVFPQFEIKKALSEFMPDVVHVQVSDPIGLSVVSYARKNNIPVVTTEHNQPEVLTEPLHIPGVVRKPVNALLSAYFRNRQSKSDFVTMPTEQAIHNLLSKHQLDIPVAAVSNGVDLSNFKLEKADENFIKECKLDKVSPTAVYVGRIDPEKKLELVIRAFREVLETMPEAKLVIAGDGVDRARLEKLVLDFGISDSVRFLGRVSGDKLYKVYNLGDVFVTASEIETQGIVLIEAAASGLPLVAVDKGAVSEVCLDGENGYLCKPGDVKEIAEAMTKILSDKKLQGKFSKKSLEIAKEHDFEKTLDKFINIYNRVLDNNIK